MLHCGHKTLSLLAGHTPAFFHDLMLCSHLELHCDNVWKYLQEVFCTLLLHHLNISLTVMPQYLIWVPYLNRLTGDGIFLLYHLNFWLLVVIIDLFIGLLGLFCLFMTTDWRWQFSIRTFLIISSISGLPFLAATLFYWWCLTPRFSHSLGSPHRWL